jgi:hypothetical protein
MKQTTEKVEKKKYGFRIRPEVNELIETHKYMNGDDRSAISSLFMAQDLVPIRGGFGFLFFSGGLGLDQINADIPPGSTAVRRTFLPAFFFGRRNNLMLRI